MNNSQRISEILFADFADEMERTRTVLAAVPQPIMDWKPGEELRSIGWNANHLAEIVGWTSDIVDQNEFDIAPPDGPPYETPSIADPAEILQKFDETLAVAKTKLEGVSDETLVEDWSMKMGGQTLFSITKGACLRKWVVNHTIHHRGILSVYLRMNGVELQPVYDG